MTVYIVVQAYEGEIRGVFLSKRKADEWCKSINAQRMAPATVEEYEVME